MNVGVAATAATARHCFQSMHTRDATNLRLLLVLVLVGRARYPSFTSSPYSFLLGDATWSQQHPNLAEQL